jgi:SAM-dependent methyltransferase
MKRDFERSIKACYSTWGTTYFRDYYASKQAYPPVHVDILRKLLRDARARNVLDAGCGPASFLRYLVKDRIALYGFDLTPGMAAEARRVLGEHGLSGSRIWEGSVLAPRSFRAPAGGPRKFDAAVCVGVLPHIPEAADAVAIRNLKAAVRPGGLVAVEARNQFFSLFTQNRYSYEFIAEQLIRRAELEKRAGRDRAAVRRACEQLKQHFRMDLPPVRKGKAGEPGYDEVLSRTHNPLLLRAQFEAVGFRDVRLLFYHYHALPPMFEKDLPRFFRRGSVGMENPKDWRGYFMASGFIVEGRRA